jgi:hypothetical protein
VELTPELNSGQALQGFINWFKQAKTISSLKAEFQFSDSLVGGISGFNCSYIAGTLCFVYLVENTTLSKIIKLIFSPVAVSDPEYSGLQRKYFGIHAAVPSEDCNKTRILLHYSHSLDI